jgi:hypothetical protein
MQPLLYKFTKTIPKLYDRLLRQVAWSEDEVDLYEIFFYYRNPDSNEEEQAAAERLMDLMSDVTTTMSMLDRYENEAEILEEVRDYLRKEYPYR